MSTPRHLTAQADRARIARINQRASHLIAFACGMITTGWAALVLNLLVNQ